jgi:hypothetical protein
MSLALAVLVLAIQQPAPAPAPPPGEYWQQQVAYDITARLDEPSGVLSGTERIQYVNRSPDTLSTFSLHLYLNAFRPGSRWADADSVERRRRFNDLADPDFAFNHVRDVRIMGQAATPVYPFAPDSTIVRFDLPRPLAPGDSMTVEMEWDARPSTTPRRQGREGRRFDFAQWYPKLVVYDRKGWQEHPLYPAGEFYGEFARFLVQLDVPEDQVVGATGVPLCGDPGWERANRTPTRPVDYQRDRYDTTPAVSCTAQEPGRKRIAWYAEDVHHFAMSLNPDYRYEGGRFGDVAVHVLYQPGDSASWGGGIAVKRTETALAWLDQLYGKFAWPQITNVHRIEGGGTEFPMMIHNGSADQGLIVHELGHNYTMGILANNEWLEGWLDEGFTSFQSTLFWEAQGRAGGYERTEQGILGLDVDGYSEPTSLRSDAYRDFSTYNTMIYSRGELFFHQLRYIVGDEAMVRILRTFYDRWKLRHVDEAAFRSVAEEVSGQDLSTFFGQWLHSTLLYDYGVGRTRKRQLPDGRWSTRVEVRRHAEGRIPVEVAVFARGDTAVARTDGLAEREWVEIETAGEPRRVVIDPAVRSHDWNFLNNRKEFGFPLIRTLFPQPGTEFYLHNFFSTRSRRDRLTVGVQPVAWYNDAGGLTLGLRTRDDYLGRFEQNQLMITGSTGWANPEGATDVNDIDFLLRARNPVFLQAPNLSQTLDGFNIEGRYGARALVEWSRRAHLSFGPVRSAGAQLQWVRTDDPRYLDPGFYESAGTVELGLTSGIRDQSGNWLLQLRTGLDGGLVYGRPAGPALEADNAGTELYGRVSIEGTARRELGKALRVALRGFGAATINRDQLPRQRAFFMAGADPYAQLYNPFVRSRGALLVQENINYHVPGGFGLRGFDPRLPATYGLSLNAELERALLTRERALFSRVALAAFGDIAMADAPLAASTLGSADLNLFGDAGIGIRAEHRIGQTRFVTRVDFPLFVSRANLAQDRGGAGDGQARFRWLFSFQPAF